MTAVQYFFATIVSLLIPFSPSQDPIRLEPTNVADIRNLVGALSDRSIHERIVIQEAALRQSRLSGSAATELEAGLKLLRREANRRHIMVSGAPALRRTVATV